MKVLFMCLGLLACGCRFADKAFAEEQADFWVAPDGKDTDPGTKERPFATLARARDAVRALRQAEPDRDILVLFRSGTYPIEGPIGFSPEDSGRAGGRITYAAAPNATPVISGGRRITGFEPCGDGIWKTTVPNARDGKWRIEQLYVNGSRAVRARTPNGHYAYIDSIVETGIDPATGKAGPIRDRAFLGRPKDIAPLLKLPQERLRDVVVSAYHSWEISRHRIVSIDPGRNLVLLTGRYPPKFGHYTSRERYYLDNFREALDAPGEWFLDRDGTLFYKPRSGEDMAQAEVVAPVTETFLRFAGSAGGAQVENILFRGLTFEYAAYLMPHEGAWSPQAACNIDAVVMADYARNIAFTDCAIRRTGTYGFWFRDGCRDCVVERCLLEDLGAGGVRLGPTAHRPHDAGQLTSHCRIDNNIIRDAGRVWPDAVGVFIGHSGDNQVTHNDIAGMPYSGISVGWRWGYGEVPSKRNTISYNRIHHLGWDVLSDMGGIYTLGEAPGTVMSGNVIHDFSGDGECSMHGIYNDNSTAYMLMESNLVYNVRDGGYKLGSGKANIVRNNIFVSRLRDKPRHSGPIMFCQYYTNETHVAATIEKNIVCGCEGQIFASSEFANRLELRNNVYWEPSGTPIDFIGRSFEAWQKLGRDAGSVIADPKFADADNNDFHLQADSPALALGFVPFDSSRAGVYGDPAWIAKAREFAVPPPWQGLPPPPPLSFSDGFEHTDVGSLPRRATSMVENKGDGIEVTEETAATGKRSLKITDAPGLKHGFNPHFWYTPNHHEGVTTFSFDVHMEQGAELSLEWRQYPGKPYYYIGPKLLFRDGKLTFAGQPPLPLPLGVWTHIEISAGLGSKTDGTWQLTVTPQGAEPKRFSGLKFGNPETRSVTWIGFISVANRKGVYYVDNVKLENN
ncbi:MAG TPA: right-handed parallel beta-helix repeat-containing protein [Kiritimatiellia bacterium]|nr:right-handed parallel beta-helix repeat-containing protein [Kiritimatiellia bacterium]HOR98163.1 right-handed parallel beta-helix repeat-containing protein [Kiritimatiellia bacterium]